MWLRQKPEKSKSTLQKWGRTWCLTPLSKKQCCFLGTRAKITSVPDKQQKPATFPVWMQFSVILLQRWGLLHKLICFLERWTTQIYSSICTTRLRYLRLSPIAPLVVINGHKIIKTRRHFGWFYFPRNKKKKTLGGIFGWSWTCEFLKATD